jgi:hypothetical protein
VDRCEECGFEYDLDQAQSAGAAIVEGGEEMAAILGGAGDLRRRPDPETWSPLEYGCHLRDVLLVQRERVLAARRVVRPTFDAMGRDERVDHDGYGEQEPGDVARQLVDAARLFANVLSRLGPEDWERVGIFPYPQPAERPLMWLARHTLHEVRHHLMDVRRQA